MLRRLLVPLAITLTFPAFGCSGAVAPEPPTTAESATTRAPVAQATHGPLKLVGDALGDEFDAEKAWSEREQVFRMEKTILKTRNIVQSAEGDPRGVWSTVIACGVFIF